MDGREKVTAGPLPESVRVRFESDTAVVEVDTVGWNAAWPIPLTVPADPVDIFFLAKLLSGSDEGSGRPGNGLGTTSGGKALIDWGPDCGPYTRVAGEGEGSITSSAEDRGESLASLGLRNLLIEDDPEERLELCEAFA